MLIMTDSLEPTSLSSAAHRCLHIDELVEAIAEHVPNTLNLALTCHAFLEAALDQIWKDLYDLDNLLQCFPDDAWEIDPTPCLIFTRPLQLPDWNRFSYYAKRVRHCQVPDDSHLEQDMFRMLSMYRPPTQHLLLPNLRSLQWDKRDVDVFPYLHLFLNPQLQSIDISFPNDDAGDAVLQSTRHICPSLRSLSVHANYPGQDVAPSLSMLVCGLKHLGSLTVRQTALDGASFCHVMSLPYVTNLDVFLDIDDKRVKNTIKISERCFPKLQQLELEMPQYIPDMTILIRKMQTTSLRRVALYLRDHIKIAETTGLCDALGSCKSRSSIKHVSLQVETHWNVATHDTSHYSESTYKIGGAAIGSLTRLSNMTRLELSSPFLDCDDPTLRLLSRSLPLLESLALSVRYQLCSRRLSAPKVTLQGLADLAKFCPSLVYTRISIDATKGPPPGWLQTRPEGRNISFRTLSLVNSTIASSDIPTTASCLSALFPKMASVTYGSIHLGTDATDEEEVEWTEKEKKREKYWGQVGKLVDAFAHARRQERRFWIAKVRCGSVDEQVDSTHG